MSLNNPLETIQKLIAERYKGTKAVFWAGSIAKGGNKESSDLDLVIVYEKLDDAYREAFIYEGWPIDAFVNDVESINYFFNQASKASLILGLPTMVADGIEVMKETSLSRQLKKQAIDLLNSIPSINQEELINRRFKITDLLDDLKEPDNLHEQMAITFELYKQLAEFYLLVNGKWLGSGKQLPRLLMKFNPEMAEEFAKVFGDVSNAENIIKFSQELLKPYGGLIWDGFKLNSRFKLK